MRPRRSSSRFSGLMSRVNDAVVMRELERIANLRHDGQRLTRRDPARLEQLAQVHPVTNSIRKKYNPSARPNS